MTSRKRLVFVGEAPSPSAGDISHRPTLALTGASGRRLSSILGLEWTKYLRVTERYNLFYEVMLREDWPREEAAWRADALGRLFARDERVVLLGGLVADAFGVWKLDYLTWARHDRYWVARIPHPSGRTRLYNEPVFREHVMDFLKPYIEGDK